MTEHQGPAQPSPDHAAADDAPVFTPRKNGPYQSVSEELAAWMRTGWAEDRKSVV